MKNHILIDKTAFFPKQGILAIGDLHLGYEHMLKSQGFVMPFNQLEQSINDLKKVFNELKKQKHEIKKIVILGDIKHHFHFELKEKFEIRDFINFLEKYVERKNIILIKGNHEKIELYPELYRDYYIEGDLVFIHGDRIFPEILDKKIKTISMGHLHTAVYLKDKKGIKKEKYKCFLVGKWKNKQVIILPSFFPLKEGTAMNEEYEGYENRKKNEEFSIIPKKTLNSFKVHVIGEERVYEFGKLKDLD